MKKIILGLSLLLTTTLAGCSKNTINDKEIVIGASISPHAEILEQTRNFVEEKGYKLVIKEYTDYVIPNQELNSGALDLNFFQHQPYLDQFNESNGTDLVSVLKIHFEPLGLYSLNQTLDWIKDGAKIGIPNDTTNGARALLLLEALNIIELDDAKGILSTKNDITSNPYNIQVFEFEAASLPAQLSSLDYAVINGNYALSSNILDKKISEEDSTSLAASLYGNVLAVKKGNETKEVVQIMIEALSQPSIRTYIEETYQGIVVPLIG